MLQIIRLFASRAAAALGGSFMATWTVRFRETGYKNMDGTKLSLVQDTVWNDPREQPTTDPITGIETTHCNQAALAVARGMGCHDFDPPAGGEPYTADQLFAFFQRKDSKFIEQDMSNVQALANRGVLVFACLSSFLLQEHHGHVVSITPGETVFSESLVKRVPICLNIAGKRYDSRRIGINFAFPMHRATPRFWAWKTNL